MVDLSRLSPLFEDEFNINMFTVRRFAELEEKIDFLGESMVRLINCIKDVSDKIDKNSGNWRCSL